MENQHDNGSIFSAESTEQLNEYKEALLHAYNSAEQIIRAGSGTELDYTVMSEAEATLNRVQKELDWRVGIA